MSDNHQAPPHSHSHAYLPPPTTGPGTGVIATVLIILVGLIALQVMSLQQSAEALTNSHVTQQELTALIQQRTEKAIVLAQQAMAIADAARPDPYTGADARSDEVHRRSERLLENKDLSDDIDHKLALVESRTNVKIGALEIPPRPVRDLLAALTRQGIRNDKAILVLSLALSNLAPDSAHAKTLYMLRDEHHDMLQ